MQSFETDRLLFRKRTMEDLEACIELDSDPEVVTFIPEIANLLNGDPVNKEKHREFVKSRIEAEYPEGMGYWVIHSKEKPDHFIGWVMLIPIDGTGPEIEIGWRLRRIVWGRGYATEAAYALIQHAFNTVKVREVVADIHYSNKGSVRVAEKIGLQKNPSFNSDTEEYTRYSMSLK